MRCSWFSAYLNITFQIFPKFRARSELKFTTEALIWRFLKILISLGYRKKKTWIDEVKCVYKQTEFFTVWGVKLDEIFLNFFSRGIIKWMRRAIFELKCSRRNASSRGTPRNMSENTKSHTQKHNDNPLNWSKSMAKKITLVTTKIFEIFHCK